METEEILAAIQKAAETIATPNWADKLSLLVSFLAILVAAGVAVYVAKKQNGISEKQTEIAKEQAKISKDQNKISLFKLRYTVLINLALLVNTGAELLNSGEIQYDISALLRSYKTAFDFDIINVPDNQDERTYILSEINKVWLIVQEAQFLFPSITRDELIELYEKTREFLLYLSKNKTEKIDRKDYCVKSYVETSKKFKDAHWDTMRSMLNLTGDD